ncbi:MAG: prepilin-type N-terminal cleavage/methylation domain-containing protein [Pseudomonadota bacterium]
MWPKSEAPGNRQAGFSLLETLVAFTIMAVVMAAILQVFAGGARNVAAAEDYAAATRLAESRLAEAGRLFPLEPGVRSGEWKKYQWVVSTQPFVPEGEEAFPGLYLVEVAVEWGGADKPRRLRLHSLRAGDAGGESEGEDEDADEDQDEDEDEREAA